MWLDVYSISSLVSCSTVDCPVQFSVGLAGHNEHFPEELLCPGKSSSSSCEGRHR